MRNKLFYLSLFPLILSGLTSCGDKDLVDFSIAIKSNEFTVLNITDTQIIDPSQCRREDRLSPGEKEAWDKSKVNELCFDIIDDLVNRTKPNLITLGGDNVYGEFDDSGEILKMLVKHLDSYKIPFTFTYGNHDNESIIGRNAQDKIWKSSKYCLYKDTATSIGLLNKNKLVRTYIMLDSNGCSNASEQSILDGVSRIDYLQGEQIGKLEEISGKIGDTPVTFIQHIPPKDLTYIYNSRDIGPGYSIDENDEFGKLNENPCVGRERYNQYYSLFNTDNVLFGHDHRNNLSIVNEGIRYTYITKTSYYDFHDNDMIGGTIQKISKTGEVTKTEHIYYTK